MGRGGARTPRNAGARGHDGGDRCRRSRACLARRAARPAPSARSRRPRDRLCRAGARRPGLADVHLGHDGRAQGCDAHAGQSGGECGIHQRATRPGSKRPRARRAAAVSHQRVRRDHACAFGPRRQCGDGRQVLGGTILDSGPGLRLHLVERGAHHDLLSARSRTTRGRADTRLAVLPQRVGGLATGTPAHLREQVRHRRGGDHGSDGNRGAVVLQPVGRRAAQSGLGGPRLGLRSAGDRRAMPARGRRPEWRTGNSRPQRDARLLQERSGHRGGLHARRLAAHR